MASLKFFSAENSFHAVFIVIGWNLSFVFSFLPLSIFSNLLRLCKKKKKDRNKMLIILIILFNIRDD